MERITLVKMMEGLWAVDDISWGMYAFSRDILRDKVDVTAKKKMIQKAICCGYEKAEEIMSRMGTGDPWEIARGLGLKVEYLEKGGVGDRVLFALFTPPDLIQIMREPIEKACKNKALASVFTEEQVGNLILGHELFHYLEEEDGEIYTKNEKIRLWKVLGFESRSTIRALSEIAGMSFTKKLNSFQYSPFALDILLYYNYSSEEALKMYREVAPPEQSVQEAG